MDHIATTIVTDTHLNLDGEHLPKVCDVTFKTNDGYYLSNGAALCEKHHLDAEHGKITPKQCLDYMGIKLTDIKVPDKIAERYKGKLVNFKDFYITLMLDALINKWGE